ncbi:hypothetical protein HanRHA438_Chr05g0245611 [Helianthus annuus]|nr:hypothetical protein HanRHA438_Chr05g0245611 [Helianthus annuus]
MFGKYFHISLFYVWEKTLDNQGLFTFSRLHRRQLSIAMVCFVSLCNITSPKTLIKDIETQKTDSCRLHLSSSTSLNVIFGFWIGPDVEDGWGFERAKVREQIGKAGEYFQRG